MDDEDGQGEPTGELPVLTAMYDLAKWLLMRVQAFPRSLRFTLGDRIAESAMDIHLALVEAAYSRDKKPHLRQANFELTKLRTLVRMAKDVRAISIKQYGYASRCSVQVGSQVGGWLRSAR
ncbi:MAG: diversity-generating retroelement protein Avd [Rubrivivax sp.]|nr:diversity-generating retroelement protein Avd [Rubrivivax sp.]